VRLLVVWRGDILALTVTTYNMGFESHQPLPEDIRGTEEGAETAPEAFFDFKKYDRQDPSVVAGAAHEALLKNPDLMNRTFLWNLAEAGALESALQLAPDGYLDDDFAMGLIYARSKAEEKGWVFHTSEEIMVAFRAEKEKRGIK